MVDFIRDERTPGEVAVIGWAERPGNCQGVALIWHKPDFWHYPKQKLLIPKQIQNQPVEISKPVFALNK